MQVLLTNLQLPQDQAGMTKLKRLSKAFSYVIMNTQLLRKMFSQLENFFEEYLGEKDRIKNLMEQQYGPRLKQKEDELSKKMGHPVQIDINSDPEFLSLSRKQAALLEDKYGTVLIQVKEDLQKMFQFKK